MAAADKGAGPEKQAAPNKKAVPRPTTAEKRRLQTILSRRYMGRFVAQVAVLTAAMGLVTLAAYILLHQRYWYDYEPLYQILHFINDNLLAFFFAAWVAGMFFILLLQWRRIARSTLALSEVIERMAADPDAPVALPADLRELQGVLQQVQAEAAHSRALVAAEQKHKNDLVVYLAHDLKTPLTSVLGYLALLRDEPDADEARRQQYIQIATGKAQRLEDLINEFFEITRLSLQGQELELAPLNLSRMLEQIVDEYQPLLEPKGLACTLEAEADIEMMADAGKLERVADNLLRNAVAYSTPGTTIQVRAGLHNGWVALAVRNQGPTIPPHQLARLFEQFYRADTSRGGEAGGAGLGLAITKEIVELHHGHITAQSADGTIEFLVQLPTGL